MTAVLSSDENMLNAYKEGKDLYAIIAQSAFDNKYEDNLEWYTPGKIIDVDGKQIVSGTGKEFEVETDENDSITVNWYELLPTPDGDTAADELNINNIIISDIGQLKIVDKRQDNKKITFTLKEVILDES